METIRGFAEDRVVPHAGTWIEIVEPLLAVHGATSFPTRERGLKSLADSVYTGEALSFPTRERGLKCPGCRLKSPVCLVVPHAGTWIEIECT